MLSIKLEAEVSRREPDVDAGLISWWTVTATREDPDAGSRRLDVGGLRVAVLRGGLALNRGEAISDDLGSDSDELEEIYETFFEEQWLPEELQSGHGGDVLYVASIELPHLWRRRDAHLAVLDRVVDVLAQGCDIVVLNDVKVCAHAQWGSHRVRRDRRRSHTLPLAQRVAQARPRGRGRRRSIRGAAAAEECVRR